ncbi:LppM family (lipo)protein [Micromonospora sp. NPDC048930]|uniref:LppM family (lipo)protein n=1 Tax=Micromonospora sp. NPDC048930 TaxID=3364261 RepID=UPI00371EDD0B
MNTGLRRSRALRLAVCLALVAALSGCMQLNLGLTVNPDDTVSGQLLVTADKNLLKDRNPDVQTAFADMRRQLPALPAGDEIRYEDARFYGVQVAYRNKPLSQFTSDSFRLVRTGDRYRFSFSLDPDSYAGKVPEQNAGTRRAFVKLMSFEISVTFPGPVLSSNGTVNGRSVSWKVDTNQDKPAELVAEAEAPARASAGPAAGNGFPWLLVVGGVVVLLLVAVVVLLLLRRPHPTAGPGATPAAPATDPGAAAPAATDPAAAPAATSPAPAPRTDRPA